MQNGYVGGYTIREEFIVKRLFFAQVSLYKISIRGSF